MHVFTSISPAAALAQNKFLEIQSIAMAFGEPITAVGTNSEVFLPLTWIRFKLP